MLKRGYAFLHITMAKDFSNVKRIKCENMRIRISKEKQFTYKFKERIDCFSGKGFDSCRKCANNN